MCFSGCDRPEFYVRETPTARKPHRCDECGETIAPGDVYERVRAKWDGHVSTFDTCARCWFVRQAIESYELLVEECDPFEAMPPHGNLDEIVCDHHEHYGLGVETLREVPRW